MHPDPRRPSRRLAPRVVLLTLLALGVSRGALAQPGPRFGDSTWVAPYPIAESPGDPATAGPRVAARDHAPVGETILRTPFRVAFLPLRLLARGIELGASLAAPHLQGPVPRVGIYTPVAKLTPTIAYSSDTGVEPGFELRRRSFREDVPNLTIFGGWSTRGQRDAGARLVAGLDTSRFGGGFDARYRFLPNARFYGIGNDAPEGARSIYRDERGDLKAWLRMGTDPLHQGRVQAGYSGIASSRGYHGFPHLEDVFPAASIPFFGQDSHLYWYGAGGDWSVVDRWRDPTRGIHLRVDARRAHSTDGTGVKYLEWQSELRSYLPVLAKRRVLALRVAYDAVQPDRGSAAIPFYRLPASTGIYRFAAYHSNQFRDRVLALGQLEYRWEIIRRLQAFGLAQLGEVASSAHRLRIADIHESYGGGLRYPTSNGTALRGLLSKGSEGMVLQFDVGTDF